jgi:hypothetical protein
MIFVYEKETKKFVGMATEVFDNGNWREPELGELYPDIDQSKLGYVYVKDSPKYAMDPTKWQFKLNEHGEPIGIERKASVPKIYLETDAVDTDGDGIPDVIADGKSKALITIEVRDAQDELVTDELTIDLKATGGTLSSRHISMTTGKTTVELTSSLETVSVIIEASSKGLIGSSLELEFMPSEE